MPSRMCAEAVLGEAQRCLMPPRVELDDARVAVDVEGALGAARRQKAQHDVDAFAKPGQTRADCEVRLVGRDRQP